MKGDWKRAGWFFIKDDRKSADRVRRKRYRHDVSNRVRSLEDCPECVKQGLPKPGRARRESWCEGLCKKHAKEKGLKKPESIRKACGRQGKASTQCKKKEKDRRKGYHNCKQKGAAKEEGKCTSKRCRTGVASPKGHEQDLEEKASEVSDPHVRKKVKVKKEPKVIAEATITKGADEGAAGCSIPKRSKRLTRFGCPLLNTQRHPPLKLPEHEKDTERQGDPWLKDGGVQPRRPTTTIN